MVPDVDAFPGHIACSSLSRSEIVVPLIRENGEVWGVLDIDSENLNTFDEQMHVFLERYALGSEDCVEVIKYKIGITEK